MNCVRFKNQLLVASAQQYKYTYIYSSVTELRSSIQEVGENNYILLNAVDDLERTSKLVCRHLKVYDDSIRCQYCRQEFNVKSQLKEHVEKIHFTTLD